MFILERCASKWRCREGTAGGAARATWLLTFSTRFILRIRILLECLCHGFSVWTRSQDEKPSNALLTFARNALQ